MSNGRWRMALGDILVVGGVLLICFAALSWAQTALAAKSLVERRLLTADLPPQVALPDAPPGVALDGLAQGLGLGGQPEPEISAAFAQALKLGHAIFLPLTTKADPALLDVQPPAADPVTGQPPTFQGGAGDVPQFQVTTPVVRIVIPSLGVDRAVIPVGLRRDGEWDTDRLFATQNRGDLVGQLAISTNPGDGGNVILVGHNYDNGIFAWEGVFVDAQHLQPGAQIQVFTQGGGAHTYQVERVKKVPWTGSGTPEEIEKHRKFLGPEPGERLTLVTCGGANMWPWPARIYVVAVPAP